MEAGNVSSLKQSRVNPLLNQVAVPLCYFLIVKYIVIVTNSVNIGTGTQQRSAKPAQLVSSKYKNLKLKKKEEMERKPAACGWTYISLYGSCVAYRPSFIYKPLFSDCKLAFRSMKSGL